MIEEIAETLSEEIAKRIYYKLLFLRYLSEIKAIETGKVKVIKGKEIEKLFKELIKP